MTSDAGCSALIRTHTARTIRGRREEGGRGRNSFRSFLAPLKTVCNLENHLKRSESDLEDAYYVSKFL